MKRPSGAGVFRELERLIDPGTVAGLTESELVARFVDRRDPIAFEAIVSRHGPMVLSVCRVMLADANDVDDAFQATFAILIEKARRLRRPERLGPWLHGVAYRVANRARTRRREWSIPDDLVGRSSDDVLEKREQLAALHDEIERLPEKYRLPVVLCCLEERSGEEAARRLGWPIGTVNGRLSRARDLLRDRLSRHQNLVHSRPTVGLHLLGAARAIVPDDLLRATLGLLAGTVPPRLQTLIAGVLSAMIFEKIKTLGVAGVAALSVVSTVSFMVAFQPPAARLDAQVAPTSGQFAKASAAQETTETRIEKTPRQARSEPEKHDVVAQPKAETDHATNVVAKLRGELELLELESTIYRDAIKSTASEIVGVDTERFEREANNRRLGSNEQTRKSAEESLANVRSSVASLEKLKKEYLHIREQIAVLKSKIAQEPGSGKSVDKDENRDLGSKRAKDDRVAHDVGKLRAELELVELESDHYRNSIKRSMALLDAWEDGHAMNNSELDDVAKRKAEHAHDKNSKRTSDKLHKMREMYIEARERIALLKSKIARESGSGQSLEKDESRDPESELGRRFDRLEQKVDEISAALSRARDR